MIYFRVFVLYVFTLSVSCNIYLAIYLNDMKKALGLYKEIIYDATHIDLDLLREAVIDKIISDKENVKFK